LKNTRNGEEIVSETKKIRKLGFTGNPPLTRITKGKILAWEAVVLPELVQDNALLGAISGREIFLCEPS
jgi:hypothetical protein